MKNKKILLTIALVLMVFGFIIVKSFNESYASSSDEYYYIRRNMLSHHHITSNQSGPTGTIMIKNGDPHSDDGDSILVYCAYQGKEISDSIYSIKELSNAGYTENQQGRLKAVLSRSYPYVTINYLRELLKDENLGIGSSIYTEYKFEELDVQEAVTATQAAIWNLVEGKEKTSSGNYKYQYDHTAENMPAPIYGLFGKIDWELCSSYNMTGRGSKSTILQAGDTTESVCTYKPQGTDKLLERINALVDWYMNLEGVGSDEYTIDVPSFAYSNLHWQDKTLTVDIKPDNIEFDYTKEDSYSITFNDLNGQLLTHTETPIMENNKIVGYRYVINNIETKGVDATIKATQYDLPKKAYYYKPTDNDSQPLIGMSQSNLNVTDVLNILNKDTGVIEVYKTEGTKDIDNIDDNFCANNTCLSGAYMALYSADKSTIIKEFITEKDKPYLLENLSIGTYYIKEITPPSGYNLNDEWYEVKIDGNEKELVIVSNQKTKVCFQKLSSVDKKMLDGAKFKVINAKGSNFLEFTTNSQNATCIEGKLEPGYYYLVELEAPNNFLKTNVKYKFAVGEFDPDKVVEELEEDENVVLVEEEDGVITILNDPGLVITKSDLTTGACVSGAKLVIYDRDQNIVDEWTSSCVNGQETHPISLKAGEYTLVETIAPSGYATSESIQFTIDQNGKASTSLDMKDAPIEVCILKTSKNSAEGLPGGEFEIYDANGNLYEKFTSNLTASCFHKMPVGTYTIKEIKAPNGYLKADDFKIEVKDTKEVQNFEILNEVIVDKTSLDTPRIIVIISTLFLVLGVGIIGYYGIKKRI